MAKQSTKSAEKSADLNKDMKLLALNNLFGKYFLPYGEGQTFTIDAKRAQELIDNKDAELVK